MSQVVHVLGKRSSSQGFHSVIQNKGGKTVLSVPVTGDPPGVPPSLLPELGLQQCSLSSVIPGTKFRFQLF